MLRVELQFPAGRYHGTPWGQHVNEGSAEWPPSPWRLFRALVATWHAKASTEVPESTLLELLDVLAREPPRYELPPAVASHTRHYMPLGGSGATAKIFDSFVHVGPDATLGVVWPATTLTSEQLAALRLLLSRMSYLGRAESWVALTGLWNGEVAPQPAGSGFGIAEPLKEENPMPQDGELIRLLCVRSNADIAAWRAPVLERQLEEALAKKQRASQAKGKASSHRGLSKSDRSKVEAMLPKNLIEALCVETAELQKQGWNEAPGACWVDYVRPRDALAGVGVRTAARTHVDRELTVARFALASQVRPRLTKALHVAADFRKALMSHSDGHPVFSGRGAQGEILRDNRHAFILPEAYADPQGRISHVTVYAPMGFDDEARQALTKLRKLWGSGGYSQQLVLIGIGRPKDFAGLNVMAGECPLLAASETWTSRTPFVPTRYPKTTRRGVPKVDESGLQIGSPEHDLRRLLKAAGYPEPVEVEVVPSAKLGGKGVYWTEFYTVRKDGGGARTSSRGFGFRVRFPEPVSGPIAVGYGAHYGLGAFVPSACL